MLQGEMCTTQLWWRWGWSDDRVGSVLNILIFMYITVIDWWRWWRWWWNTLEKSARKIAANDVRGVGAGSSFHHTCNTANTFSQQFFLLLITHPLQFYRPNLAPCPALYNNMFYICTSKSTVLLCHHCNMQHYYNRENEQYLTNYTDGEPGVSD